MISLGGVTTPAREKRQTSQRKCAKLPLANCYTAWGARRREARARERPHARHTRILPLTGLARGSLQDGQQQSGEERAQREHAGGEFPAQPALGRGLGAEAFSLGRRRAGGGVISSCRHAAREAGACVCEISKPSSNSVTLKGSRST